MRENNAVNYYQTVGDDGKVPEFTSSGTIAYYQNYEQKDPRLDANQGLIDDLYLITKFDKNKVEILTKMLDRQHITIKEYCDIMMARVSEQ